jgi:hypothetical protein
MDLPLAGKDFRRIPQRELPIFETSSYHAARAICFYVTPRETVEATTR